MLHPRKGFVPPVRWAVLWHGHGVSFRHPPSRHVCKRECHAKLACFVSEGSNPADVLLTVLDSRKTFIVLCYYILFRLKIFQHSSRFCRHKGSEAKTSCHKRDCIWSFEFSCRNGVRLSEENFQNLAPGCGKHSWICHFAASGNIYSRHTFQVSHWPGRGTFGQASSVHHCWGEAAGETKTALEWGTMCSVSR